MTNVSKTPEKRATRRALFQFAVDTLEQHGWKVSRIPRGGKASLRQITKGNEHHKVSIRTSQDAWIAFPPKSDGSGWVTLDDVDFVVAVSVDDRHDPRLVQVHMIPADDARRRFARAYQARKEAGYSLPLGRGVWLSLYDSEAHDPVTLVGGGMGLEYKPIAAWDLAEGPLPDGRERSDGGDAEDDDDDLNVPAPEGELLTISEAKRRLAETLGVPQSAIKITVEH